MIGTTLLENRDLKYYLTNRSLLKWRMRMSENNCANCSLRAKYDNNPKSFAGWFWRWHINFCPGWKKYFTSLPPEEKVEVGTKYNFKKYQL